jgi:hypothetical protein
MQGVIQEALRRILVTSEIFECQQFGTCPYDVRPEASVVSLWAAFTFTKTTVAAPAPMAIVAIRCHTNGVLTSRKNRGAANEV